MKKIDFSIEKIQLQRFITLWLLLIICGCGWASGRKGDLPPINEGEAAGKVVVVRTRNPLAVLQGWRVDIDGEELFGIGSGEYTDFLLPAGYHYITLRCLQPAIFSETLYHDSVMFVVEESQTVYFVASPSLKCGKIRRKSEAEANKHIEHSKFIDLEK